MPHQSLLRSLSLVLGSQSGSAFISLWRNVVLARALGPEEVGAATLFSLVLAFVEMVTDPGADRFLARDPDFASAKLGAAHAVAVVRGGVLATILLCGSWFVPTLGGVATNAAFAWLALTVALRGFQHLGPRAASGRFHFGPAVRVELVSQIGALVAAFPLSHWMPDYRSVLVVAAIQSLGQVIATHAIAREAYRPTWQRSEVGQLLKFGAPLLLDGLFVFAINQGDRAVISACLSPDEVGRLTATLSLALVPTLVLARVAGSIAIPYLSRAANHGERRRNLRVATLLAVGAGCGLGLAFAAGGGVAVGAIYGAPFRVAGSIYVLLGIGQALRVVREAWIGAALAFGDSALPPRANSFRLAGVGLAFAVGSRHPDPVAIVCAGLLGELLATVSAGWFLTRRLDRARGEGISIVDAIRSGA